MTNAAIEGDPPPLRVYLHGDGFATVDADLTLSAFGPSALRNLAEQLLQYGYSGDQLLDISRGGKCLNRLTLREASNKQEIE